MQKILFIYSLRRLRSNTIIPHVASLKYGMHTALPYFSFHFRFDVCDIRNVPENKTATFVCEIHILSG